MSNETLMRLRASLLWNRRGGLTAGPVTGVR